MRVSLLIVAALLVAAVAASSPTVDQEDAQFVKFQDYIAKFKKSYASFEEMLVRFENFKASLARIEARNAAQPGEGVFGVTKFSDLSVAEFKSMYLGYRPSNHTSHARVHIPPADLELADSCDWRDKGAVTPVKDQGQCGSCWAFSTAEEIESMWFLAGKPLTALSPQQINSCDTTDGGCNGGDTITAYAYVQKAKGLETEAAYPYTSGNSGATGTCKFDSSKVLAKITGYTYATPKCTDSCTKQDETTLAKNLQSKGPVSVCVYADSWMDYTSGILKSNCPKAYSSLDHCVQLVGFNNNGATPYWILRNSWNTDWGVDGYIYVQSGANLCGVADEATFATI